MRNFEIKELQELDQKSSYVKKVWKDTKTYSLKEWSGVNPLLENLQEVGIIERETHKGIPFIKAECRLKDGTAIEYDLSRQPSKKESFEEGDLLNISSIKFVIEGFNGEKHLYITGDVE